jgi:aminoglycoside phosphotransferase (APT) family kinase protein
VASDPTQFLSLGLCSEAWLIASIETLARAASSVEWEPTHVVHNDIRSDNICFRSGHTLLVDWEHCGLGDPLIDLMGWLPSLAAEGGPRPEEILPAGIGRAAGGWAALYSGYYARHARPEPGNRNLQYLVPALSWAVRALGLKPLDGEGKPFQQRTGGIR